MSPRTTLGPWIVMVLVTACGTGVERQPAMPTAVLDRWEPPLQPTPWSPPARCSFPTVPPTASLSALLLDAVVVSIAAIPMLVACLPEALRAADRACARGRSQRFEAPARPHSSGHIERVQGEGSVTTGFRWTRSLVGGVIVTSHNRTLSYRATRRDGAVELTVASTEYLLCCLLDLELSVDGLRVFGPGAPGSVSLHPQLGRGEHGVVLTARIPIGDYARIRGASSIRGRFGTNTFSLTDEQVRLLAELAGDG